MINLEQRAQRAVEQAGFQIDFPDFSPPEHNASTRISSIADLRSLLWSSIDNDTSRDLDQIEYAEKLPNGDIRVQVGIADVDEFVPRGSLLDERAAHNATSVYTGVSTFPMLPRELSEGASSLLPNQDCAAIIIAFSVAENGETRDVEISRALVRNRAQLVYEEVGAWLEDAASTRIEKLEAVDGLRGQLLLQDEAARRLQIARERSGALDIESLEVTPVMKDGHVIDLRPVEKNGARRIIENFMVTANMAVAAWLPARDYSQLARVVREPERWPRIREIAAKLGDALPDGAEPRALSAFMERRKKAEPQSYAQLSLSIVKLLGPGLYEVLKPGQTDGHFGLGEVSYVHSTAPNRRYPDLITQRIVKAALQKAAPPYSDDELAEIAAHCNEREAAAQKVERLMRKVAAAALFHDRIGQIFDGVVTGSSPKGVWVRTFHPPVEGRVVRGENGMDVGERVRVKLVDTNVERGFIDFAGV